jgi:UDP-glucose/GDP-mannose dehydrogenase family, UDP binding domain
LERVFGDTVELAKDPHSALRGPDCAIVMTEWDEFRRLKAKDYIAQMRKPVLVDARRFYNPAEFSDLIRSHRVRISNLVHSRCTLFPTHCGGS